MPKGFTLELKGVGQKNGGLGAIGYTIGALGTAFAVDYWLSNRKMEEELLKTADDEIVDQQKSLLARERWQRAYQHVLDLIEERKAELERQAELARQAELERQAELARLAELERQAALARQAELEHQAELARLAELERQAELAHLAELERQAELARQAELERQAELARQAELEAELARQAELERQAELARQAELEAELARQAELERQAELARQAELEAELARQAELERQAELARQAELERQAELARQAEVAEQKSVFPPLWKMILMVVLAFMWTYGRMNGGASLTPSLADGIEFEAPEAIPMLDFVEGSDAVALVPVAQPKYDNSSNYGPESTQIEVSSDVGEDDYGFLALLAMLMMIL